MVVRGGFPLPREFGAWTSCSFGFDRCRPTNAQGVMLTWRAGLIIQALQELAQARAQDNGFLPHRVLFRGTSHTTTVFMLDPFRATTLFCCCFCLGQCTIRIGWCLSLCASSQQAMEDPRLRLESTFPIINCSKTEANG